MSGPRRKTTINLSGFTFGIADVNNGAFTVEISGQRDGTSHELIKIRARFDGMWMVSEIGRALWKVIAARRLQLTSEVEAAEEALRKASS